MDPQKIPLASLEDGDDVPGCPSGGAYRKSSYTHVRQWDPSPNVVTWKDEEHALAAVENYKPGQVDVYVDALKGGTGVCKNFI